jgi:hypothetical protein
VVLSWGYVTVVDGLRPFGVTLVPPSLGPKSLGKSNMGTHFGPDDLGGVIYRNAY